MRPVLPENYHERGLEALYFRPGGVGIDVGANVGLHSVAMAQSMAFVLAVEPDPRNFMALMDTLQRHRTFNVWPVCRALSDKEGMVEFRSAGGQSRVGGTSSLYDGGAEPSLELPACPLDRLTWNLGRVDFIKIDVEGHEHAVLRGAEGTLQRFRPTLLIENHEQIEPGYGVDWAAIESWLGERGYVGFEATHCNVLFRHQEAASWPSG